MHKLNLQGLPPAAQELSFCGCYAFLAPLDNLVLDTALHAVDEQSKKNVFLVSPTVESFFASDFAAGLTKLNNAQQVFPFSFSEKGQGEKIEHVVLQVLKELAYYAQVKQSLTIIHLSALQLKGVSTQSIDILINRINFFATKYNVVVLLLLCGPDIARYRGLTNNFNKQLNGVVYTNTEASVRLLEFDFWHHSRGVFAKQQYKLAAQQHQLYAEEINNQIIVERRQFEDEKNVLLVKNCVPQGTKLPAFYLTVKDNDELLRVGLKLAAATLVFSVTRDTDLSLLARQCFELRSKCGRWLKLVVQNVDGIIRHQDECLFLTLGVNLILYSFSEPSRLLSQIQSIQGFEFSRPLPENIDDILSYSEGQYAKGYLSLNVFSERVEQYSEAAVNLGLSGVLVVFELLPRIEAIYPLHLFHIKREGDIISASDERIFLYLHACREHDVDKAIKHLFKLDIKDFFIQTNIISEHFYIQQECKQLRQMNQIQNVPDYTLALAQHTSAEEYQDVANEPHEQRRGPSFARPAAQQIILPLKENK